MASFLPRLARSDPFLLATRRGFWRTSSIEGSRWWGVQQTILAVSTASSSGLLREGSTSVLRAPADTSSQSAPSSSSASLPEDWFHYSVLENRRVSHDAHILRIALPPGRNWLGWDGETPTCLSVEAPQDEDGERKDQTTPLVKSYSPITHPGKPREFSLLVKSYPPQEGGGVGHALCSMSAGDALHARLKPPRMMHGSAAVLGRGWRRVGLIGGGTGVAPLLQVLEILLASDEPGLKVSFVNFQSTPEDDLLGKELKDLVDRYPGMLEVTNVWTQTDESKRGTLDLVRRTLPDPALGEEVMLLVCGRDGFVEHWAGPVGRGPDGGKIQGPLLGLLQKAGYKASQVFKY